MRRLVLGFGNRFRRDDGAGHEVAAAVGGACATRLVTDGDIEVVELLADYDEVHLVDGVRSGKEPGTIHRLDTAQAASIAWVTSSHAIGVPEVLGMAAALETLPAAVHIIGIEVGDTRPGVGLSPPVAQAAATVARELSDA